MDKENREDTLKQVNINPTKPVSGNLAGTFAGAVATAATGWLFKAGYITMLAGYFCSVEEQCSQVEGTMMIMTMTVIGGIINYLVTHFAQVRKLKELYDLIPTVYNEYPSDRKSIQTIGAKNGNYNK